MKKLGQILSISFLLFCLACRFGPMGLTAESGDRQAGETGCASARELLAALEVGDSTVTVSGDILWDVDESVAVSGAVTVELGEYGIEIPETGTLHVEGPICFSGSGTVRPVIESRGDLSLSGGARVEAEGEGCTAVRAVSLEADFAEVCARGQGSTALELTDPGENDLVCGWFYASGEGSTAVRSAGPVRLLLCRAEGETAVAAGGPVVLDGSAASPAVPGASVVERVLLPGNRVRENGLCISAGAGGDELAVLCAERLGDSLWSAAYDAAEQLSSRLLTVPADYSGVPGGMPEPGTYAVTCTPRLPDWFPLEFAAFSIPLHVVEENRPFLWDAQDSGEKGAFVRFFQEISGAERVIFWYSLDGGETWRDAAELPGSVVLSTGAQLENLEINRTYWLCLEVKGGPMAGSSNVLEFPFYDQYHVNGGGSRDNDDRGDMGELPAGDFIVPPDTSVSPAPVAPFGEAGASGSESASESGGEREGENSAPQANAAPLDPPGAGSSGPSASGVPGAGVSAMEAPETENPLPLWAFFLASALLLAAGAGALALRSRCAGRHGKGRRRP